MQLEAGMAQYSIQFVGAVASAFKMAATAFALDEEILLLVTSFFVGWFASAFLFKPQLVCGKKHIKELSTWPDCDGAAADDEGHAEVHGFPDEQHGLVDREHKLRGREPCGMAILEHYGVLGAVAGSWSQ
mmetsp:Transcript_59557/g.118031  ORF Transcript_59557/g.118031 Transcript_59557/m.118031 type:complete len:130 (-) Transcript_59557:234-623(-)